MSGGHGHKSIELTLAETILSWWIVSESVTRRLACEFLLARESR